MFIICLFKSLFEIVHLCDLVKPVYSVSKLFILRDSFIHQCIYSSLCLSTYLFYFAYFIIWVCVHVYVCVLVCVCVHVWFYLYIAIGIFLWFSFEITQKYILQQLQNQSL